MDAPVALIAVPFAIFFGCCVSQFWFLAQVRNALIDRHPDIYLQLERKSFFPGNGVFKIILSGRHRDFADPDLSKAIVRCRWLFVVAIGSWLAIPGVGILISLFSN